MPETRVYYVNFKVNFSLCVSSQFVICIFFSFFYSTVWHVVFTLFYIILSMSIQPYGCKDNKILSCLSYFIDPSVPLFMIYVMRAFPSSFPVRAPLEKMPSLWVKCAYNRYLLSIQFLYICVFKSAAGTGGIL